MASLDPTALFYLRVQPHRTCKYGENAWQQPAVHLYDPNNTDPLAPHRFELIEGEPSYNNLVDLERLLQTITHIAAGFELNYGRVPLIAIGVKHGNACGVGIGDDPRDVLQKMLRGDPLAIFGGLVMTNFPITLPLAQVLRIWGMHDQKRLLDGIFAPSFSLEAQEELSRRGAKCRLLANQALGNLTQTSLDSEPRVRYIRGDYLIQPNYTFVLNLNDPELVRYGGFISPGEEHDLLLAWAIGSTSNSNTITITKNGALLVNAVGQQDRVGAGKLGQMRGERSGHDFGDAVAYSDSFFPFPDGPEVLVAAGISAILTSSGSVNDKLTIALCESRGVGLMMIPDAKGRGFFGH